MGKTDSIPNELEKESNIMIVGGFSTSITDGGWGGNWSERPGGLGKSSLLHAYRTGSLPKERIEYNWTGATYQSEIVNKDEVITGEHVHVRVMDQFSGRGGMLLENYMRITEYKDYIGTRVTHLDAIMYVVDITDPGSKDFILENQNGRLPSVLIGTKLDLREDKAVLDRLASKGLAPISYEDGLQLAQEIGASAYVECSALTGEGVKEAFDAAIRVAQVRTKDPVVVKKKRSLVMKLWSKIKGR